MTMEYKCDICPAEFKTQRGLDNHECRWYCKKCRKHFKTQKGYERHVVNHEKKKERDKQQEIERKERLLKFQKDVELLKVRGLFKPKYKPGDKVILSTYAVTKPTHEQRWNRMVRVRYEEERRYFAGTFTVGIVIEPEPRDSYMVERCLRNNEQYPVEYVTSCRKWFNDGSVFENMKEAEEDARTEGKAYKDSCDFAASCR